MYPSGEWAGFWEQPGWGRQPMEGFELNFSKGVVSGRGDDVVGRFVVTGEYDTQSGAVQFEKEYLGRHTVKYAGQPDGEGCIQGTWTIETGWGTKLQGPFLLRAQLPRPTGEEEIYEIIG